MNENLKILSAEFLRTRHQLSAYLYGLTRDVQVAEDLLQEVFLRLVDSDSKNMKIKDLPAWCRGVARNLVMHHWRSKKRNKVLVDSEILDLFEAMFEEGDECSDLWDSRKEALQECLEALPSHSKEILDLKYAQGLKASEIAARLDRKAEAVLMNLSRLRKNLEGCIDRKIKLSLGAEAI